jgi:hypothetical protein
VHSDGRSPTDSTVTRGVIAVGIFIMLSGVFVLVSLTRAIMNLDKKGGRGRRSLAVSALCLALGLYWGADLVAGIWAVNLIGKPDSTSRVLYWVFWVFDRHGLLTF